MAILNKNESLFVSEYFILKELNLFKRSEVVPKLKCNFYICLYKLNIYEKTSGNIENSSKR